MSDAVVVALIGLAGVLVTALASKKKTNKIKHMVTQAENEVKFQKAALSFGSFIKEWGETHKEIENLLNTTEIDRFMILRAWNGALDPKWTTAVFQMRKGEQEPISYVHFELDQDYVSRLKDISLNNINTLSVEDLPDCSIKNVYKAEGVTQAVWAHLSSEPIGDKDCVSHTYCSFATHEDAKIEDTTVTKCAILAGRLKGVAMAFNQD